VPAPAVTASSPLRTPGSEGAKRRMALQLAPPASVEPQLVVSRKSPVSARISEKAVVPVLRMVTVWVSLESPVTATAFAKLMLSGVTLSDGLTTVPFTPG